jgi:broad specificity phosphatase PhoE
MKNPSPCTFTLIRHGETEWNRDGRWQGHADVPLSAAGRAQASRLARRLAEEGPRFDALYSSDLARAWETAEILGGALGLRPAAAPALREIDLGVWSGKTHEEIAAAFPEEWRRLKNNEDLSRGGGETFAALQSRVLAWLDRTAQAHSGGRVCAVTHGGCIRSILLQARGWTWAERDQLPPIGNTAVFQVEGTAGVWRFHEACPGEGQAGDTRREPEVHESTKHTKGNI